ncbi:MAG: cytochrome D1 domain-containing protein [Caulobacteraceae bacterium]
MKDLSVAGRLAAAATCIAVILSACGKSEQAAAPAPYRVYVTNETSGTVTVIDEPTHTVAATITLGKRPRGMQASEDGRQLFVALTGSPIAPPGVDEDTLPPPDKSADGIGIVNTPSLMLAKVLKGANNPEQLALVKGGKLYAPDEDTGALTIIEASTGAILGNVPVGKEPEGVAVSPDGAIAYVTAEGDNALVAIDLKTNMVIKRIPVGTRPRSIAFSRDGLRVYVSGENDASVTAIDAVKREVAGIAKIPGENAKPMGVAISPDGKRLYVTTGRGGMLVAIDTATMTPQKSVAVGARPWGVALSPDGKFAYTANGASNDVSIVDTATMTIVAKVKSEGRPWGVTVAPRCCG